MITDHAQVERRRYTRRSVRTACKSFQPGFFRFCAGETCDVSAGGCRFIAQRERRYLVGEALKLGIAMDGGAVLEEEGMLPCRVRRVRALEDGRQEVAVEFDRVQVRETAFRRAA